MVLGPKGLLTSNLLLSLGKLIKPLFIDKKTDGLRSVKIQSSIQNNDRVKGFI